MGFVYVQKTGSLYRPDGSLAGVGYSGHELGLNNPSLQDDHGIGPLPEGAWTIGSPVTGAHTGPFSLPLSPLPGTETFGRSEFFIHGDAVGQEGRFVASHGCLIFPPVIRHGIWDACQAARDFTLRCVAEESDVETTPTNPGDFTPGPPPQGA